MTKLKKLLEMPLADYVELKDRAHTYVENYFQRSGRTEWPTIRETARHLKLSYDETKQVVEDSERLFLSYYNVVGKPDLSDWFIEAA